MDLLDRPYLIAKIFFHFHFRPSVRVKALILRGYQFIRVKDRRRSNLLEKEIPRQLSARSSLVTCVARRGHLSLFTLRTRCPRKCPRVYLLRSRSHKSPLAALLRVLLVAELSSSRARASIRDCTLPSIFKRNYDTRSPGNPAETRITARLTATRRAGRSLESRRRVSLSARVIITAIPDEHRRVCDERRVSLAIRDETTMSSFKCLY